MNDLLQPEDIIRALFHRHKPIVTRQYRHPKIRGLLVETRVCETCGKPLKMKVRAE
jgi:hypothetical protein